MKNPISIIILLLIANLVAAQKENNLWYFGNLAGLDFNSPEPVALFGNLETNEGCASVADQDGQLLFYTNGLTIWDRNHQMMPNGEGLEGGWSSTQSALIVKQPGSLSNYYVFTTSDANTSHLSYSLVDMNLNGGNGDIVKEQKNILLEEFTGEKIAATYHGNGNDIWIVSHRSESDEFVSFLLTSDGLMTTPVVSSAGSVHDSDKQIGPVRISHDGSKIVCSAISSLGDPGIFEIFDFDICTGVVSNVIDLNDFVPDTLEVYGIEFSPSNSLLYFTYFEAFFMNYIYQLDLNSFALTLLLQNESSSPHGTFQLGPDNKIYFTQWGEGALSVIHFPDIAGPDCQLEELVIPLADGALSAFGLPNPVPIFIPSTAVLLPPDTSVCEATTLTLDVKPPAGCNSPVYLWNDASAGSQLTVTNEGIYWLEVTCSCQILRDTIQVSYIECPSPCDDKSGAIYGSTIAGESGYSLAADEVNKVFYSGGLKNTLLTITKFALDGSVLWIRTFDIVPDGYDFLNSLILDSDGMLVLSGSKDDTPFGYTNFAMRYDPDANQILWAKEYTKGTIYSNIGLIEKGAGGNYIMSGAIILNSTIAHIVEIDRINGDIIQIYSHQYEVPDTVSAGVIHTEMMYHDGILYSSGVVHNEFGDRSLLLKMDVNIGEIIWSKMGHINFNSRVSFIGIDLVVKDNFIYSLYHGSPGNLQKSKMYVQKTSLEGNLIWLREYSFSEQPNVAYEMIVSGDGLVIVGQSEQEDAEFVLFKIDNAGEIIWQRGFRITNSPSYSKALRFKSSQLIQIDTLLVFTAIHSFNFSDQNMMVLRTDREGIAINPCIENFDANIVTNFIKAPDFFDVILKAGQENVIEITLSPVITEDALALLNVCSPVDSNLNIIDTTVCEGQSIEGYYVTGIYIDTFPSTDGCDSIRMLNLTVVPTVISSLEESICLGESFEGYIHTGTYIDTLTSSSGCDSIRTLLLHVLACEPIVHYDLEACSSYMHNGSHMDYSEFIPAYPNVLSCSEATATIVHRSPPEENKHSCTPGVNGFVAMCISSFGGCAYEAGHINSLVYEVQISPQADSLVRITSLSFFEKAPDTYSWIDGPSGPNNFPQLFALRILKNGIEIYREEDIETSSVWTLKTFDFISNESFMVTEPSSFRFELLPYCPVGNGAEVSAWDIDEISVFGGCVPMIQPEPVITGNVHTKYGVGVSDVEMQLATESSFSIYDPKQTGHSGDYMFDHLQLHHSYFLQGYKNDDVLNGVSTVDLLLIRKHLLGITPFTSLDQYIAADINHNGKISVLDLAELQKLLLGINTTFSNNTSWRFGPMPQDMTGSDIAVFNEVSLVESLVNDTLVIDFLGIKIGDISGNVLPLHPGIQIEKRSEESFPFILEDQIFIRDQVVSIPVRTGEDAFVEGLQLAINIQNLELTGIKSVSIPISADDYSIINGVLRISWTAASYTQFKKDDILFEIICKSPISSNVSKEISFNHKALHPELYLTGLEIKNIDLIFTEKNGFTKEESHRLRIEPNPVSTELQIHFTIEEAGQTYIRLFDSHGRLLHDEVRHLDEGVHKEKIVLDKISGYQGVIYCQVISTTYSVTEKFVKI